MNTEKKTYKVASSVEIDDKAVIMIVTVQKSAQVIVHLSLIAVERLFLYDLDAFFSVKHASQIQYYRSALEIWCMKPKQKMIFFADCKRPKPPKEDEKWRWKTSFSSVKRRNETLFEFSAAICTPLRAHKA